MPRSIALSVAVLPFCVCGNGITHDAEWRPDFDKLSDPSVAIDLPRGIAYLRQLVHAGLVIEHGVIPPYLTALWSITADEPGASPRGAVLLRHVVIEEMVHMTNMANLLNAIGGTPVMDRPDFVPDYPAQLPFVYFNVSILPFSQEQMAAFARVEEPAWGSKEVKPGTHGTLSEFYICTKMLLAVLVKQHGEAAIFTGDATRQVTVTSSVGIARPVYNYSDAKAMLTVLLTQGEGSILSRGETRGTGAVPSHYWSFRELAYGREYKDTDVIGNPPTGPMIDTNLSAVRNFTANTKIEHYAGFPKEQQALRQFASDYTDMLVALHNTFNGSPGNFTAALRTMYTLGAQGRAVMRMPDPKNPSQWLGCAWEFVPERSHFRGEWGGIHL